MEESTAIAPEVRKETTAPEDRGRESISKLGIGGSVSIKVALVDS